MHKRSLTALTAAGLLVLAGAGCLPTDLNPFGSGNTSSLPNALAPRNPSGADSLCPDAEGRFLGELRFDGDTAVVDGRINVFNQVDIYEIGELDVSTKFHIEADETTEGLDPQVGIFDEDGLLVGLNDDQDVRQNLFDSLLIGSIRRLSKYYVAVEASRIFSGSCPTKGGYKLTVQITAQDASVTIPPEQRVFLDFDGAEVSNFPGLGNLSIRAMNASDLGLSESVTDSLKERIVSIVLNDYSQIAISFSTSDESTPEAPFTTVVIGAGDNQPFFGIADEVDSFNLDLDNVVLVFVNVFRGLSNDLEELAIAIANVVSHELGHGLGLFHIEDDALIMDRVTPDTLLVRDQEFGRGVLSDFLVGQQDAVLLLGELLGLL
jgi:hypothetical protein